MSNLRQLVYSVTVAAIWQQNWRRL